MHKIYIKPITFNTTELSLSARKHGTKTASAVRCNKILFIVLTFSWLIVLHGTKGNRTAQPGDYSKYK